MFPVLKRLFRKESPLPAEIPYSGLVCWVEQHPSLTGLSRRLQRYFERMAELRAALLQNADLLRRQEISEKEKRQVAARIQHIVLGHRDNYVQEIVRFAEGMLCPAGKSPLLLQDYQAALVFNREMEKKLDQLAQRTTRSYGAAQHLFFEQVQQLFTSLGELNLLVKQFPAKETELIGELQRGIGVLAQELQQRQSVQAMVQERESRVQELLESQQRCRQKREMQEGSPAYRHYEQLLQRRQELERQQRLVGDDITSFFFPLRKPLKKYGHAHPGQTSIMSYLEDSAAALEQDSALKIEEALQALKKDYAALQLSDKQEKELLSGITRAEQGYLRELQGRAAALGVEMQNVCSEISQSTIMVEIQKLEVEMHSREAERNALEKEVLKLKSKLEKGEVDGAIEQLRLLLNDIFRMEIRIKV